MTTQTKYATIVADPPWLYKLGTGVTFDRARVEKKRNIPLPYPQMTLEQIHALPVESIAADDAHLYLWTTQKYLEAAFDVARSWGFEPSATLAWCKAPRGWQPGRGAYMNTLEFVIYARRGKLPPIERCTRQWWEWKRGEHSAKPEAFMDIVESVSPGPRVELFSRRARLGWDTWGNESLGQLVLEGATS